MTLHPIQNVVLAQIPNLAITHNTVTKSHKIPRVYAEFMTGVAQIGARSKVTACLIL